MGIRARGNVTITAAGAPLPQNIKVVIFYRDGTLDEWDVRMDCWTDICPAAGREVSSVRLYPGAPGRQGELRG